MEAQGVKMVKIKALMRHCRGAATTYMAEEENNEKSEEPAKEKEESEESAKEKEASQSSKSSSAHSEESAKNVSPPKSSKSSSSYEYGSEYTDEEEPSKKP